MRFRSHIELKKGQLDIAPLIDVVFLLLIFFMLTSSFISQEGIKVNLPSATSSKPLPREDLTIFVTNDNQLMIDKEKVSISVLKSKIKMAAREKTNILIEADKEAFLGKVVEIWDLCRDAGIANVNIATIRKD